MRKYWTLVRVSGLILVIGGIAEPTRADGDLGIFVQIRASGEVDFEVEATLDGENSTRVRQQADAAGNADGHVGEEEVAQYVADIRRDLANARLEKAGFCLLDDEPAIRGHYGSYALRNATGHVNDSLSMIGVDYTIILQFVPRPSLQHTIAVNVSGMTSAKDTLRSIIVRLDFDQRVLTATPNSSTISSDRMTVAFHEDLRESVAVDFEGRFPSKASGGLGFVALLAGLVPAVLYSSLASRARRD